MDFLIQVMNTKIYLNIKIESFFFCLLIFIFTESYGKDENVGTLKTFPTK